MKLGPASSTSVDPATDSAHRSKSVYWHLFRLDLRARIEEEGQKWNSWESKKHMRVISFRNITRKYPKPMPEWYLPALPALLLGVSLP